MNENEQEKNQSCAMKQGRKKPRSDIQTTIDGKTLEEVDEYQYLGKLLTLGNEREQRLTEG